MEINDDQILGLIRNPSSLELGFKTLMDKYQEKVYWQIRKMVHDHEDANDILQNTFIKVYRYIGKFEEKSSLYTWIYRISINEAISFLNKRKKKKESSLDEDSNAFSETLKADPYFCGDEIQLKLVNAISCLPPKQKAVFNFRYYDEMPYQKMSEILGTSQGALKASYHHAVKKIEEYLLNQND